MSRRLIFTYVKEVEEQLDYEKKKQIDSLYKNIRSKKYAELEDWEKYLEIERVWNIEKKKKKKAAGFQEVLYGDYIENLGK